jgi:two-component system NtrC family sensor kinase
MKAMKLHTKTTLMASAITVAVLAATLTFVSARVADLVRDEQKALAELQAVNLADRISDMPEPRDPQDLARAAELVRGARPNVVTVRVWERVGGSFVETAAAANSAPAADIPEETRAALRSGLASKVTVLPAAGDDESLYRVLAPVTASGRISGAVEVVETLDSAPSIAVRYERTAMLMTLVAVALITLGAYLLFRRFVRRPAEALLSAMSRAEAGDLSAGTAVRTEDELGLLARGFDRMLARIREMTEEREGQRLALQERVGEATAELRRRNDELEELNREVWRMTRRLTELERLAAAGQTAAQFAHEVGTPLNLISGHVQLLRTQLGGDRPALARLETVNAQIERIERIVRAALDRTRPDATALTPVDLNSLLGHTFDTVGPALDARGVRLVRVTDAALPPVEGDADRLQQVFINLINNALDAMPGGGELRVSTFAPCAGVRGRQGEAPHAAVEFADTGCGMSEEVRAHIFDPLYTTKERGRGTGLGLMIVRQVMREHGGDVEVETDVGRGSRFRLRFPAPPRGAEAVVTSPTPSAVLKEVSR